MQLADEYGLPVSKLQRFFSALDSEELFEYRKHNPHWSTKLIDAINQLALITLRANGDESAKRLSDVEVKYSPPGEQLEGEKQTDEQMRMIGETIAAMYNG